MVKSKKKDKKAKGAKASPAGRNAPSDLATDETGTVESSALNETTTAELMAENEQLKLDIIAMKEGDEKEPDSAVNPSVHCKAFLVTPIGKQAKNRGLLPRKIEYACDSSEAIRQYACSYVGSGKESQSLISDFTYRAEELLDRRPRSVGGVLLFDLPLASFEGANGKSLGRKELVSDRKIYYIKSNELIPWPNNQYSNIDNYRPKHVKQPLTVAG